MCLLLLLASWLPNEPKDVALALVPTPEASVVLAAADAARLDAEAARQARYLSLYSVPPARRKEWCLVLAGHVNFLSRSSDLVLPTVILGSGANRTWGDVGKDEWAQVALLRVGIDDYGWKRATYDKLAEQDHSFHIIKVTEVRLFFDRTTYPGWVGDPRTGRWHKANEWRGGDSYVVQGKAREPALVAWPGERKADGEKAAIALAARTGSVAAILQAESFLWQTGAQFNRTVGYYGLLEVKDRRSFQFLVGFDPAASRAFSVEMLAAVGNSGVARQPRRIGAFDKVGGDYLSTFDVAVAKDRKDALTFLDDGFDHDAEEVFAHGANGLWKMGLFAKDGARQDSAPDFVGFDRHSHDNDGKIHVYHSCIRCHDNGGVQDVNSWTKRVLASPLQLKGYDREQLLDLRRKYTRNLEGRLENARRRHEGALKELLGITHKEYAAALDRCWQDVDSPVTLERAARESGLPKADFQGRLRRYQEKNIAPTSWGMYARDEDEIEGLPYEVWQNHYSEIALALRGLQQVK